MKDLNEILNLIEDIQDLPISEETVGAYIEGSLNEVELQSVEKLIGNDDRLSQLIDSVNDINNDIESMQNTSEGKIDWDIYSGDMGFWEFGIPSIIKEGETLKVSNSTFEAATLTSEESYQFNKLQDMNEQKQTHSLWGESGQNFKDPFFIQQPDDHSCALRSQQIVLRDYGIDIPFKELERIALEYGIYSEDGTWTTDIGKVLELAGVPIHQAWGATIHDLTHELAQGHRIIVSVDANELWHNDTLAEKYKNWYDDVFGKQGGNHALIVAGIEVNPNNPSDVKVVLTDPGSGDLRIEYPMSQFIDAWQDSNFFMAATNNPAPYQYDPSSGKEVPSNFVIEQHFNEFITNNSYTLAPDLINVPDEYVAKYEDHLDMVGDMTYEEFDKQYKEIVSSRNASEHIGEKPTSNNSTEEIVQSDKNDEEKHSDEEQEEEENVDDERTESLVNEDNGGGNDEDDEDEDE